MAVDTITEAERQGGQLVPLMRDPQKDAVSVLEQVVIAGDLSKLSPEQRVVYYRAVCESLELNPLTRPFDYITLNGKLTLYANRSCTDQLRRNRGIDVPKLERERADDLAIVTAYGNDRTGRTDSAIGAVSIANLRGEALANALMKAETKAKRRLTLSLAGLGLLDEIEAESVPGARKVDVDAITGEIAESTEPAPLVDTIDAKLAELEAPIAEAPAPTTDAPVAAADEVTTSAGSGTASQAEVSSVPSREASAAPSALCGSVSPYGDGETCTREAGHEIKTCRGSDGSTWNRPTAK